MGTPTMQIRPENPVFLDLPWESSVDDWGNQQIVTTPIGDTGTRCVS